jgi:outer membrane protein assembly factor BamA
MRSVRPILFLLTFFLNFLHFPAAGQSRKDSSIKNYHILVLPLIARSIETDWSLGVASSLTFHIRPTDTSSRTSNLQGVAIYSLRKQFVVALNGTIYFPGEKYILSHQFSYSSFPDKFWGLGNKTPNSAEEPYRFRQFYIYLHGQRSLGNNLYAGIIYQFQDLLSIDYVSGGLFDQQDVKGRSPYHVSGLGLSLTYDTRNNAFSPDKGQMFQVYYNRFASLLGSNFSFNNYVFDLRKYIGIHQKQVLAFQLYGFFNTGQIPLRNLASLGGSNGMRGYYEGRFRDLNQIYFQSEFRAPLFWRLGAVVFGGIGDVSGDHSQNQFNSLKYSYGGGLRIALNKTERLNLRLDYGAGRYSSHGFYFQLGEAF